MKPSDQTQRAFEAILDEEKKRLFQPLARYLARRYNGGESDVISRLCDDELDRTGNLLGWVRQEAGLLRVSTSTGMQDSARTDATGLQ